MDNFVIGTMQENIKTLSNSIQLLTTGAPTDVVNVQADWAETDEASASYIQGKPKLFTGSYNDLKDKPTDVVNAVNVQADWDETDDTSAAYIQGKPQLFTGSYDDLKDKPTNIVNVQANWAETDDTSDAYIRHKPTNLAPLASPALTGTPTVNGQVIKVNTGDGALTDKNFTAELKNKLDNIADGANVSPSWLTTDDPGYVVGNTEKVAVGNSAGQTSQGTKSVAVGNEAGKTTQGRKSVAVGNFAGHTGQGANSVAVGNFAGHTGQKPWSVAVGDYAGNDTQGDVSVAVGSFSGQTTQGANSVAVGNFAGQTTQGANSVATGYYAGQTRQGTMSVAVGNEAGKTDLGDYSIAIGNKASQAGGDYASTIVLNATRYPLDPQGADGTYIAPIGDGVTTNILYYNSTTKEVTTGAVPGGGGNGKVYGSWQLVSDQEAQIYNPSEVTDRTSQMYTSIKGWQPVVETDGGVVLDEASGLFSFTRQGIYMVSVRLSGEITGPWEEHRMQQIVGQLMDTNDVTHGGASILRHDSTSAIAYLDLYVQFNAMIKVTNIATKYKVIGYITTSASEVAGAWKGTHTNEFMTRASSLVTVHNLD